MRGYLIGASLVVLCAGGTASAILNEFSVADGYSGAFSTRVWTYNPLWTFDGGNLGSNYVAQHGYGSGFAFSEPYALVIRNDSPGDNYRFSYAFEAADLGGVAPTSVAGQRISVQFDACSVVSQSSSVANSAAMLTMAFGGTRANPGLTLGFSDSNKLMYSDAANNLQEYAGYTLNSSGWDRITLTMDFTTFTYDLVVQSMSGSPLNASNTWTPVNTYNVITGAPLHNAVTSMGNLYFETFTDPENGLGWQKSYLDHFVGRAVPTPGALGMFGVGALAVSRRRRRW